jgi:hypothetical protein
VRARFRLRGHNKNPPINIIIRVLASLTQSGASCWPPEAGRPAVSFGPYCISHTRAATCIRELSEHGDAHAGLLRRGSRDHQPGWASDVWPGGPRDVRAIDSARLLTWGGPAELMEGGPEPLRSSGWKPFGNGAASAPTQTEGTGSLVSFARMSRAGLVQTKGFGLQLCSLR